MEAEEKEGIEEKNTGEIDDERLRTIEELDPDARLRIITESFLSDLECVKEMFEVVVPSLKKKDEARKARIDEIVEFFKALKPKPEGYSLKNGEVQVEAATIFEEAKNLADTIRKLDRANTMFRQNAVLNLVSLYDRFLSEVYSHYLRRNPGGLARSERKLSYNEILQLGSIEEAIDRFVAKEVDHWLRQSHTQKLEDLDKRLKLGLIDNLSSWSTFIELVERRHLFAHTGGRVNDQYVQTCEENKVTIEVKEGEYLGVSEAYFEEIYRCLFEVGVRIGQAAFRRLYPDKLGIADRSLNQIGYGLLRSEQWELAEIVFDFALNIPRKLISGDIYYRMYLINKCIALRQLGKQKETVDLLESMDWSAAHPKFVLAVHTLKEEYDQAEEIMSSMNGDEPSEYDFLTWPLFKDFRKTEFFKRAFKKVYGKEYEIEVVKEMAGSGDEHLLSENA
jgi:hypothetical protein